MLSLHVHENVKTKGSAQPIPLTRLALDVVLEWKEEQEGQSPFPSCFPVHAIPRSPSELSSEPSSVPSGRILSRERLGGLHHRYDRAA